MLALTPNYFLAREADGDMVFGFIEDDAGIVTHMTNGGSERWIRQ